MNSINFYYLIFPIFIVIYCTEVNLAKDNFDDDSDIDEVYVEDEDQNVENTGAIDLQAINPSPQERPVPGPCINYYKECYIGNYNDTDVDNALEFLKDHFTKTNTPLRQPCTKLRVRKNIKCLNDTEKDIFKNALLACFGNTTFISSLTQIHTQYWIPDHKFTEGLFWHAYFLLQLEKCMVSYDSRAALHYHDNLIEWKDASNSIVWDILGYGDPNNAYCINGTFKDIKVTYYDGNYTTGRCIKREMPATMLWEPPEWATSFFQMGIRTEIIVPYLSVVGVGFFSNALPNIFILLDVVESLANYPELITLLVSFGNENIKDTDDYQIYTQLTALFAFASHFKRHLDTGGLTGDLSAPNAPNDPDFWCFHSFDELLLRTAQLNHDANLVQLTYQIGMHMKYTDHKVYLNNIKTDVLNYYTNIKLKEVHELGFGEFCYIYDHLVVAIKNERANNIVKPEMYWRIRECLSQNTTIIGTSGMGPYQYYFPDFYANDKGYKNITNFSMYLPEVGNCNPKPNVTEACEPFITASIYNNPSNPNYYRQYQKFQKNSTYDFNITPVVNAAEKMYMDFIKVLNDNNCCTVYSYYNN